MARGTIGFNVTLINHNLAGFSRQVAFLQALPLSQGFPRMESETRRFRIHFAGKESLGVEEIDLYLSQREWEHLVEESNLILSWDVEGPT